MNIERYQNSFSYLDAQLMQLNKGSFDSTAYTFSRDSITLDRRVTSSSHLHHCLMSNDTLNLTAETECQPDALLVLLAPRADGRGVAVAVKAVAGNAVVPGLT